MEKHFFNRFHLKNRLFHEGRLVFKEDGGTPEDPAGTTEAASAAPEAKPAGERALDALKALYEKEKLQEKERDSASARALEALHIRLERKDFEKTFIDETLASGKAPKLNELALTLLKDPAARIVPSVLDAVVAELESLAQPKGPEEAAATRREGAAERARLRGKTEREQLKEELPQVPRKPKLDKSEFIEILDSGDEQHALDPIKIAVKRENYQINAATWDHSSIDGLRQIYLECKRVLGNQKINSPFYTTLFATLANAADPLKNHWREEKGEDYVSWFKDPLKDDHRERLMGLPADDNFYGGEQFVRAYEHLHYLKSEVLHSQDVAHVATLAKQEGLDSDPVATKVTDFLRDNVAKFSKAIRERDYATAGMYAVGIWALYKSIKELSGGKDSKITKYLIYGIGAYAGYTFAKNAGYDILKIAGFKDKDFEVKGTPFEVMKNFIGDKPEYNDFDYGVAFRMSEVRLKDLHKMLEETNKKGDFFIHPKDFPAIFPDLVKEWPFDMGLGEKGLGDTEGMGNKKLSAAQREYLRVGRQIYLTAMAMEEIYNQTLYKDHPDYKDIPYEEAIKDPVRNMGKVRHLLWAAREYSPDGAQRLFSEKTTEEAEGHIDAIFEGKNVDATVEELLGPGYYSGHLKGFPVVFARDKDSYRVYLQNDYNGLKNPGAKYVRIPIEGPTRSGMADKAIEKVDKRMEELMEPIKFAGGRMLATPEYRNGEWQTEVELPGADEFGIQVEKKKGILRPRNDGKGVSFLVPGTPVRINIDDEIARQYPIGLALIPKIVSQDNFNALRVFHNARRIKVGDVNKADKEVTLLIGKSDAPLKFKYKDGKFELKEADEEKFVHRSIFAKEYIDALNEDEQFELNDTVGKLKKLVEKSPQNFFPYLFRSLTGQTKESPLDGANLDSLSGSVPAYFSHTVLDVTKYETLEKLRRAILDAKSLDAVNSAHLNVMHDTNARLTAIYDILSRENLERDSWDRDEFVSGILFPVRSASTNSSAYALSKGDFEYQAYDLLNGILDHSDFSKVSHEKAGELMMVFAYYTAYLDNPKYGYKDPNTNADEEIEIDLDNLDWPATQKFPGMDIKKDPGMRGHYIIRYFDYVKQEIVNRARGEKLKVIPAGSARNFWQIMDFDEWLDKKGSYQPLDPLDNMPPITHDPDAAHGPAVPEANIRSTDLEKAIAGEFDKAVAILMAEYGTALNYHAIQAYLKAEYDPADPAKTVGIFRTAIDPVTGQEVCQLWQWADRIALESKRSGQMHQIQDLVYQSLIKHIFENPQDFFTKKISMKARILKKWPGLRDISFIPDWINPLAD